MFHSLWMKRSLMLTGVFAFAFMTQACAKKEFTPLTGDQNTTSANGNTNGGTNGQTTGQTTGQTSGQTTGSTNGQTSGTATGGTTTGGTTGFTSGGTTTGGTTGFTSGGTTSGGTTGFTSGGTTMGGTTTGGTTGLTSGGTTSGGSTTGDCSPFDPSCVVNPRYCVEENYNQPASQITKKLDILIITDSSSSLDSERESVANGVVNYLAQLPNDVDARFAVMLAHGPTSWFSGRLYKSDFKDPREKYVISSQTNSPSEVRYWMRRKLLYRQNNYSQSAWDANGNAINGSAIRGLPTDFDADGGEAGLLSLYNAVKPYSGVSRYSSLQNLAQELPGEIGFFRQDAALAIVFVSDENDICTFDNVVDPDNLEASFRSQHCGGITPINVVNQLRSRRQSLPLYVSSIIYSGAGSIPTGLENGIGHGYNTFTQLANSNNSGIIDIATNNIQSGLSHIAALTSTRLDLRYDFDLHYNNVDASTIDVKVDGQSVNSNYNDSINVINLINAGGANSSIQIAYCLDEGAGLNTNPVGVSSFLLQKAPRTYKPTIKTMRIEP